MPLLSTAFLPSVAVSRPGRHLALVAALALVLGGCGLDAARVERMRRPEELAAADSAGNLDKLIERLERPVTDADLDARMVDVAVLIACQRQTDPKDAARETEVVALRGRLHALLTRALTAPPPVDAAEIAEHHQDAAVTARVARAWRLHALDRLHGGEHRAEFLQLAQTLSAASEPEALAVVLSGLLARSEELGQDALQRRAAVQAAAQVLVAAQGHGLPSVDAAAAAKAARVAEALGAALLFPGVPSDTAPVRATAVGDLAVLLAAGAAAPLPSAAPAGTERVAEWAIPVARAAARSGVPDSELQALVRGLQALAVYPATHRGQVLPASEAAIAALLNLCPSALLDAMIPPCDGPRDAGSDLAQLNFGMAMMPLMQADVAGTAVPGTALWQVGEGTRLDVHRVLRPGGGQPWQAIYDDFARRAEPVIPLALARPEVETRLQSLAACLPAQTARALAARLAAADLGDVEALRCLRWQRAFAAPDQEAERALLAQATLARLADLLARPGVAEAVTDECLAGLLPGWRAGLRSAAVAAATRPGVSGPALARLWLGTLTAEDAATPPTVGELVAVLTVPETWPLIAGEAAGRLPGPVRLAAWAQVFAGERCRDARIALALVDLARRDRLDPAIVRDLLLSWIPHPDDDLSLTAATACVELAGGDEQRLAAVAARITARWPALLGGD